jgi:hypothetical protein
MMEILIRGVLMGKNELSRKNVPFHKALKSKDFGLKDFSVYFAIEKSNPKKFFAV